MGVLEVIQSWRPKQRITETTGDGADATYDAKSMQLAYVRGDDRYDMLGAGYRSWQFSDRDLAVLAEQHIRGSSFNSAAMQCVAKLVLAYQAAPLRVYRRKDDEVIPGDSFQQLFDNPNPWMSQTRLKAIRKLYQCFGGNAYEHIVRSTADGQPLELYPYHDGHMRPVAGKSDWIKYYLFTDPDGNEKEIPAADVIHYAWPIPDPENPIRGMSPFRTVARELGLDNEMTRLITSVLKNDAMMRGALVDSKGTVVNEQQRKLLQAKFQKEQTGENRGRFVPVLSGGLMWQQFALGLNELDLSALRRVPEDRIAAAFLIPAIYSGLTSGQQATTYDNLQGSRQFFYEDTVVPMWQADADTITRALLPPGDARYFWHYTKDVIALRKDLNAISARVTQQWQLGLVTRNEARAALELDPVEDALDGFYADVAAVAPAAPDESDGDESDADETVLDEAAAAADGTAAQDEPAGQKSGRRLSLSGGPAGKSESGGEEVAAKAYWKSYDNPSEVMAGKLEAVLSRSFMKLASIAAESIPAKNLSRKDRNEWEPFSQEDIERLLPGAGGEELLGSYIASVFEKAAVEVGANWSEVVSAFDVKMGQVLSASTDLIRETAPTVKRELQELLARNWEQGPDALKRLIRERFESVYSESRAAMIARTTATYSTCASQREAWTELDTGFSWLSQRSGGVRDSHARADGKPPDEKGFFRVGSDVMRHPGAGSVAAENVNCRCVLRARPKEKPPKDSPQESAPKEPPAPRGYGGLDDGKRAKGTPVSKALDIKGAAKDRVRAGLEAIEKVHGDGKLSEIPVLMSDAKGYEASFGFTQITRTAKHIKISKHADHPELSFVHEVGHYLDLRGMGAKRGFKSAENVKLMKEFHDAVEESGSIKWWRGCKATEGQIGIPNPNAVGGLDIYDIEGTVDYVLAPHEIFARAYAQYIAKKSGSPTLLTQLNKMRQWDKDATPFYLPYQWGEEEFEPIFNAMDKLLENLNWRK